MADTENQKLRDRLQRLEQALRHVVERNECHDMDVFNRKEPCGHCSHCVARAALEDKVPTFDWRLRGALHSRVLDGHHPRECRIMHAFAEYLDGSGTTADHKLGQILDRSYAPTALEWYVASTMVQWLATNVGMSVLEQAGFKYTRWEEDK